MNVFRIVALISALCVNANLAFTSGDDKFIKKYAMMKVYENCFGPEVVKEVRKEMKIATAKCNGNMPMSVPTPGVGGSSKVAPHEFSGAAHHHHQQQQHQPPQHHQQQHHHHARPAAAATPEDTAASFSKTAQPSIDINKLQQAILAGYNKHLQQQSSHQPYSTSAAQQQQQQYTKPWSSSSSSSSSFLDQQPYMTNALFYPPGPSTQGGTAASAADMYLPRIATVQQQQQPYAGPYPMMAASPMYQPYYQPFFPTHRTSRVGGFDVRSQMDAMTAYKMTGKIRNVTCVMQELGYLNHNMEPDYENMNDRVMRLPISEELKQDMVDGITYCKKFSMCVPDERKDKFAKELVRPMFFFKCYKHKKLESCIMKDIRDRYTAEEFNEDGSNTVQSERSMRSSQFLEDDTIEQTVFDYVYGDKSVDLDALL